MRYILIILLFIVMPHNLFAWDKQDTYREIGYLSLHLIDWNQTLHVARNPDQWGESNPILGHHPSVGKVNIYFAITGLSHIGISTALPPKYRYWWQWTTIYIEGGYVGLNFLVREWY